MTVLKYIEKFINEFGIPKKFLTDNRGEFINKSFKNYCKRNEIIFFHRRSRHLQTQGAVER